MIKIDDSIVDFFEFIYDRQEIWHKRKVLSLPSPWSNDFVFQNYKFCNVYRELDGGTLAICKYLQNPHINPAQKLFNLTAYRFFNRRDTIENLFGGLIDPYHFDFEYYEKRFDKLKEKGSIFSNAYLISSHPVDLDYRPKDKHIQILLMLKYLSLKIDNFVKELQESEADEGLMIVRKFVKMAGPFLSGQILLDASYCNGLVKYTANDFLIVGPGAKWGLDILFGKKLSQSEADKKCRYLWKTQEDGFEKLKEKTGKDWFDIRWRNPEYQGQPYLALHDIQNSLCEFRKYWRLKHQEKAKKRYFRPNILKI